MYELLAQYKPLLLLQLPQVQDEDASEYWRKQYAQLRLRLEQDFAVTISDEKLKEAIQLCNRFRLALKDVLDLAQRNPTPLTGMQLLSICFRASFMPDLEQATAMLQDIAREIGSLETNAPKDSIRLLLTGVPSGMGSHKVIQLLEECGARVVCIDNCTCYKKVQLIMDEHEDPLVAMAQRYLATPCSVMSPNPNRYTTLKQIIADFSVDGVVDLTWQGCQTYDVESYSLKKFVREELDVPFLQVVTDYSPADIEQLKVRIEAFLEMLA